MTSRLPMVSTSHNSEQDGPSILPRIADLARLISPVPLAKSGRSQNGRQLSLISQDGVLAAIDLLLHARAFADDVQCDAWAFAVDWATLRDRHVTLNDMRWLLMKGFVLCKSETTYSALKERRFRTSYGSSAAGNYSFILTAAGESLIREMFAPADAIVNHLNTVKHIDDHPSPFWDASRRTLFFGKEIVKQFRVRADTQEMILAAFQEEGWPPQIDDPLPPRDNVDRKRRLHDTICRLNHKHRCERIRFSGNGTGEGVLWSEVDSSWALKRPQ